MKRLKAISRGASPVSAPSPGPAAIFASECLQGDARAASKEGGAA